MLKITPDVVIAVVVALLSLFFDYFPGVSSKFDALPVDKKRLITAGLAAIVTIVAFVSQCSGVFQAGLTCQLSDAVDFLYKVVIAVAVMYGFHMATKPVK